MMMTYMTDEFENVLCQCICNYSHSYRGGSEICNATIINYTSWQEAKKAGWVYTSNIHFCDPDKKGQWVCPKCIEKYKKEQNGK